MRRSAHTAFAASLCTAAALLAGGASAATFDFGAIGTSYKNAHDDREGSWEEVTGGSLTRDGVSVTASSSAGSYIHFDGAWSLGGDAGIGPCGIADCNASDEDGFGPNETITLMFSQPVSMMEIILRESAPGRKENEPDHTPPNGTIMLNGIERVAVNGVLQGVMGQGTTWTFGYGGSAPSDYYLNTVVASAVDSTVPPPAPVPLPAGALLLGTALAGLGLRARLRG